MSRSGWLRPFRVATGIFRPFRLIKRELSEGPNHDIPPITSNVVGSYVV